MKISMQEQHSDALRGSASVKKDSLNAKNGRTKIMNVKPVLHEQQCMAMNDDAGCNCQRRHVQATMVCYHTRDML